MFIVIERRYILGLEPLNSPPVKFLCREVAHAFEPLVHSPGFYDDRNVASRLYRDGQSRNLDTQNLGCVLVSPKPVVLFLVIPFLKVYHQLNLFLVPDCTDSIQVRYIDYSQPPDLHVVCKLLVATPPYQAVAIKVPDFHHIVGNKAVATLYKLKGCLAFSYATFSLNKDSNAVHFHQVAIDKLLGGKYCTQYSGKPPCKLSGGKGSYQKGTLGL